MAWLRLSDDYINDEKIFGLSNGAFRLWHEGMAYCRRHQTDGIIPFKILRGFRSFSRGNEKQLSTPARENLAPLWVLVPGLGYKVHNYLNWNLSKEEEENDRAGSAARQRKFRERNGVTNTPCNAVSNTVHNALIPDRIGISRSSKEEKAVALVHKAHAEETGAEAVYDVARDFSERYSTIYAEERNGANFPIRGPLHFDAFVALARGWPDAKRLEDMFRVFLHLPGRDVINKPGTPKQFLHHAPECDQLLRKNGR